MMNVKQLNLYMDLYLFVIQLFFELLLILAINIPYRLVQMYGIVYIWVSKKFLI